MPSVWLITFPPDDHGNAIWPLIMLHEETPQFPQARILFEMACMIGYITKAQRRILDPDAPHGVTMLPRNPSITSLLHQFAIALLCLDPACPEDWSCQCNLTHARYNAPPPGHEQPTTELNLADLSRSRQTPRPDDSTSHR